VIRSIWFLSFQVSHYGVKRHDKIAAMNQPINNTVGSKAVRRTSGT
jgi:hypothetical protein